METITRKEATDLDQTLYLLAKRDLSYKIEINKLTGIGKVTIVTLESTGKKIIFLGNKRQLEKCYRKAYRKAMVYSTIECTRKALKKANDDLKYCNRIMKEAEEKVEKSPLEIRMLKFLKNFIQEQGVLIVELEWIQNWNEKYLNIFE